MSLSVNTWITMGVILVLAIIVTRTIRFLIAKANKHSIEKQKDLTRINFFKNAISFVIWLVAIGIIISMVPALRSVAVTLLAGAGILVAVIGFAAQEAFANIIGGIFIIIFKPFRIGDMIKVGALDYGIVEDITLRHTVIVNFENKRIIVPNSKISSDNIINDSIEDERVCRFIEVGISYDSDLDLAIKIMQEEAMKHPLCVDNRTSKEKKKGYPQIEVRFLRFNDYSIDLRAYVWTNDPLTALRMHSDINRLIKLRFDKEGIEIPFPYRTIVYKKDLEEKQNIGNPNTSNEDLDS
ncbi:MAG: mechanosensitive ion channel family protein [Crocinitomicaceae bacterium]